MLGLWRAGVEGVQLCDIGHGGFAWIMIPQNRRLENLHVFPHHATPRGRFLFTLLDVSLVITALEILRHTELIGPLMRRSLDTYSPSLFTFDSSPKLSSRCTGSFRLWSLRRLAGRTKNHVIVQHWLARLDAFIENPRVNWLMCEEKNGARKSKYWHTTWSCGF